jgi:exonuclease VII large subunit
MQQRLQQQQQQLIDQQQQRLVQYRDQLDQQQRLASQQAVQLQQQRRAAQYAVQQQYITRLRDQQLRIHNTRNYNYWGDPYFYTPPAIGTIVEAATTRRTSTAPLCSARL